MATPDFDVDVWKSGLKAYETQKKNNPWNDFTPEKKKTHRDVYKKEHEFDIILGKFNDPKRVSPFLPASSKSNLTKTIRTRIKTIA